MIEPHTCLGLCACSGKTCVGPKLSPLADLEALHKQGGKAEAIFSTNLLSVEGLSPNMYRTFGKCGGLIGSRPLRKSLSNP